MKVNKRTRYKDVVGVMTREQIQEVAKRIPLEEVEKLGSLFSMTIGEFINIVRGDFSAILEKQSKNPTLFEVATLLKWLEIETKKAVEMFAELKPPTTPEHEKAQAGVPFLSFEPSLLLYAQQKFFLKSLEEAEKIKLSEVFLHKRNDYANDLYQYNLNKINLKKYQNAKQ